MQQHSALLEHLTALYGSERGTSAFQRLAALIDSFRARVGWREINLHAADDAKAPIALSERDVILITYPDQVQEDNVAPLRSLAAWCSAHLKGLVTGIHILPFYPSSSDDGFSVIDYRAVDPAFGTWQDVALLGRHFRLMFDAVVNHVSTQSRWFQGFLADQYPYRDYFVVVPEEVDLSSVVRPRTSPLLTRFDTPSGQKAVWTTFSADQVDLNYANPAVLLEIIDTLLYYVAGGAEFIRLDAIAYLWKEFGTPCIYLPQTHRVVQLLRMVLDAVAPHVLLITETNVPHRDNISYFGDGTNEAQAVYNFALPPLVLHAFHSGSARTLSRWAAELNPPSRRTTFFNFLASHDGIGINPVRGILSERDIEGLVERSLAHGGLVSYKSDAGGRSIPYELNINYFDALSAPAATESLDVQIERFVTAHAIMLALAGLPGIYFHSLFGSRGWPEGVTLQGHNRAINRQKLSWPALDTELARPASLRSRVFARLARLLRVRAGHGAFHPHSPQQVLEVGASIFGLLRTSPDTGQPVVCLQNVSAKPASVRLGSLRATYWRDLLSGDRIKPLCRDGVTVGPYATLWLAPESS